MKKFGFTFFLFAISSACFCQKLSAYNTFVASTFDNLNNKPFASLELEDTSGNTFNTSSLLGKTIYVDFWFTTCPPCVKEIPYSTTLQKFFANDTNVVFLNICIENIDQKPAWKQMIKTKEMHGIHLFYARNRPQKINLLREYKITFPTYLLVNKEMKITGYDAPRPSQQDWVHWAIIQAKEGQYLSASFKSMINRTKDYITFIEANQPVIDSLRSN